MNQAQCNATQFGLTALGRKSSGHSAPGFELVHCLLCRRCGLRLNCKQTQDCLKQAEGHAGLQVLACAKLERQQATATPLPHQASAMLTFMMLPLFSFLPCAATLRKRMLCCVSRGGRRPASAGAVQTMAGGGGGGSGCALL